MAVRQDIDRGYYANEFNRQNYTSNPLNDPAGQLSIPVTFSFLVSESLFMFTNSPATTLILPFYRPRIPYGYFIIIALELLTILFVKWSSVPVSGAGLIRSNFNQSLPDINALRQIYSLPPGKRSLQDNVPSGKVSVLKPGQPSNQDSVDTPLFPKGLTVNLSVSAPFTEPRSKTATLYTVELIEIKNVPGYVVPILALLLYFFLYSSQKAQESNSNNNPAAGG